MQVLSRILSNSVIHLRQVYIIFYTDLIFYSTIASHHLTYTTPFGSMILIKKISIALTLLAPVAIYAQPPADSNANTPSRWSYHFQFTGISQSHLKFHSNYSGNNSLADTADFGAFSVSSTLFFGRALWKGAAIYIDPEVSGGEGLSYALGVAGALNGETYRIGSTAPSIFIARGYFQQHIALGKTPYTTVEDDVNQVAGQIPRNRLTISAGKFAASDFFDNNNFSHDPRTQFFNWSLWANGAWDYPANTRGYTMGLVVELVKEQWGAARFSTVAVPTVANHPDLEYVFGKAHSETLELEKSLRMGKHPGAIRVLFSHTASRAPSYAAGLAALKGGDATVLPVISGNAEGKTYGGGKYALTLNVEQEINANLGFFARLGWNDGKYASWAFTEIDRTGNTGFLLKGSHWHRPDDVVGLATVFNGISSRHREFLKQGGYGFIIGDGTLNYGMENITEFFYNAKLSKSFWLTFDYQFVRNPGYNKDRGPVNVFGFRGHIEL